MTIFPIRIGLHTRYHERNPLRMAQVSAINQDGAIERKAILCADFVTAEIAGMLRITQIDAIRGDFYAPGIHLRIMLQHILNICRTHTADRIAERVKLLLLSSEIPVHQAFYPFLRHQAHIHGILRENVFQQQIGRRSGVLPFQIGNRPREGDGWRGIHDQIEMYISQVLLDGPHILSVDQHLTESFLKNTGLLQVQRMHLQGLDAFQHRHLRTPHGKPRPAHARPFPRLGHIDVPAFGQELPQQVGIDPPAVVVRHPGHCQKEKIHSVGGKKRLMSSSVGFGMWNRSTRFVISSSGRFHH